MELNRHQEDVLLPDGQPQVEEGFQPIEDDLKLENVHLTVEKVKDFYKMHFIGGTKTLLGMKNSNNFLIATQRRGLILIKDGIQIYIGKLSGGYGDLKDIIYIPSLNCYFLALVEKLYRKDIDDKPGYLFMDVNYGFRTGGCFRYSDLNQRLITVKDFTKITILNPKTKKLESLMKYGEQEDYISDFRIFGEQQDRLAVLEYQGQVTLCSLTHGRGRGQIGLYQIMLLNERYEEPISIEVCPRNKYLLVEIGETQGRRTSRLFIFQVVKDTLVKKTCIEPGGPRLHQKNALACCGYVGTHVLWVGMTFDHGKAQLFDYDTKTGVLRELVDKRVDHEDGCPTKLHRHNGKFFYTGVEGALMSLSVNN